jgi:hypothetical protein
MSGLVCPLLCWALEPGTEAVWEGESVEFRLTCEREFPGGQAESQ